jgi:serine/threonine protein kinase
MSENLEKLGKFIIEAELGKGAMGVVYKATDPFINRTVALKTIHKGLLGDQAPGSTKQTDSITQRFKREAQAAGLLNHPNIVSVYEYGEDQDTAFIAMEFVQGRSLKDIFDNNERFDMNAIIEIMSQILVALAYFHKHGIVHRDIKPANVIIMPDGQVKIADFGIAHVVSSDLTQTGMMIGTPNYMSPEQFMGQIVDGRSDLFCAGIIFYQFVTGENPFDGRTMATVMHKVLSQEPLDPYKLNLQVSAELNRVIKQALAKRPDDRFQTAETFFQAIIKAFDNNKGGQIIQSPEALDGTSKTIILPDPITEKYTSSSYGSQDSLYDPFNTFYIMQLESEKETSTSQIGKAISTQPPPAKSDDLHKFQGNPSRFKRTIVYSIIAAVLILLIVSINRFMGLSNNPVTDVHDSNTMTRQPSEIPDPSADVKSEEMMNETSMATKSITDQPQMPAMKPLETKSSAVVSIPSSESAMKKTHEKKVPEKEHTPGGITPPSSHQTTDVFDTQEELKEKSDTARKDTSATTAAKAKHHSCKDIYLKISLGEKLSAEEQRIINNCR